MQRYRGLRFQSTCPVRGTTARSAGRGAINDISIHVPRTGHDETGLIFTGVISIFQSTCPVRGTTTLCAIQTILTMHFNPRAPYGARRPSPTVRRWSRNFNPRAPYGARRREHRHDAGQGDISIHVPRTGHDGIAIFDCAPAIGISIHVPRTGHDVHRQQCRRNWSAFQSTCPVRGTTSESSTSCSRIVFQSTCPVRGTTPTPFNARGGY